MPSLYLLQARRICKRLRLDPDFATASTFDTAKILKIQNLLGGCGTAFVRALSANAVFGAVEDGASNAGLKGIKGISRKEVCALNSYMSYC